MSPPSTDTHRPQRFFFLLFVLGLALLSLTCSERDGVFFPEEGNPACLIRPSSINFGTLLMGAMSDTTIVVRNFGSGPLFGNVAFQGENDSFFVTEGGGRFVLEAGQLRRITIRFNPAAAESAFASLKVASYCDPVQLSGFAGEAREPVCELSTTVLDFEEVPLRQSATLSFVVSNTGTGPLPIDPQLVEPCSDFEILQAGASVVAAGFSTTINVRYVPSSTTTSFCNITVSEVCSQVSVLGRGTEITACTFSPDILDFGTTTINQATTATTVLTNTGNTQLVGSIADCNVFTVLSGGNYDLEPDSSQVVTFSLSSPGTGFFECDLTEPCPLAMSGTVVDLDPLCSLSALSLDFGDVDIGQSASLTFSMENTGGSTLRGVLLTSCPTTIEIDDPNYSLTGGETKLFTVTYTPTDESSINCTFSTEDCDDPVTVTGRGVPPQPFCTLSADIIDFGTLIVGQTSDRTVLLENQGPLPISGTVSTDCNDVFFLDGTENYTMGVGGTHEVKVRFAPATATTLSCELLVDCNDLISVVGTAEPMVLSCAPDSASVDFGSVFVTEMTTASVTFANTGTEPLSGTFALSGACDAFTLDAATADYDFAPGETHQVDLEFAPSSEGTFECTLSSPCGDDVLLSGAGTTLPVFSCAPENSTVDFGTTIIGKGTATRTITFTNDGTEPLSGTLTLNGACEGYEIETGTADYNFTAGQTHDVTVNFTPQSAGQSTCELVSPCGDNVSLTANGADPVPVCDLSVSAIDFGTVLEGESAMDSFTITNNGTGVLAGSVALNGCSDVTITQGGGAFALANGETHTVNLTWSPNGSNSLSCSVDLGTECGTVSLAGEVDPLPVCSLSTNSLSFSNLLVGEVEDMTFDIENVGGQTLEGSVSQTSCPDFMIFAGAGDYSLGAGESKTVTVRFDPQSGGAKNCTVNTSCGDVTLSGSADEPTPMCEISTTTLPYGLVTPNTSKNLFFTITNTGNADLSGTVSLGGGCSAFSFVSGGGSYTLAPNAMRTVIVAFTPTDTNTYQCTINPGTGCASVTATGEGAVSFSNDILSVLQSPGGQGCVNCHTTSHSWAVARIDQGNPTNSPILLKPSGQVSHSGGIRSLWGVGQTNYNNTLKWIQQGALNN